MVLGRFAFIFSSSISDHFFSNRIHFTIKDGEKKKMATFVRNLFMFSCFMLSFSHLSGFSLNSPQQCRESREIDRILQKLNRIQENSSIDYLADVLIEMKVDIEKYYKKKVSWGDIFRQIEFIVEHNNLPPKIFQDLKAAIIRRGGHFKWMDSPYDDCHSYENIYDLPRDVQIGMAEIAAGTGIIIIGGPNGLSGGIGGGLIIDGYTQIRDAYKD